MQDVYYMIQGYTPFVLPLTDTTDQFFRDAAIDLQESNTNVTFLIRKYRLEIFSKFYHQVFAQGNGEHGNHVDRTHAPNADTDCYQKLHWNIEDFQTLADFESILSNQGSPTLPNHVVSK